MSRGDARADARAGRLLPPGAENIAVAREEFSRWTNDERNARVVHDLEIKLRKLEHENAALRGVAKVVARVVLPYVVNGK